MQMGKTAGYKSEGGKLACHYAPDDLNACITFAALFSFSIRSRNIKIYYLNKEYFRSMKGLISLMILVLAFKSYAQQVTGKVIRIADGDSFTLLTADKKEIRIRLYGIDCPEHGQPYSKVAKEFTGKMLSKGQVTIIQKDIDRYERIVGIVIISDSINLNERLLQAGLAWHYKYFDKNPVWAGFEKIARENKKGLWQEAEPIAPWLWRKGNR